jgi:hypothetical protein
MFAIEKLKDVPILLSRVYKERLEAGKLPKVPNTLRGPVALFLVREDGANGSKLGKEVVGSFRYWDHRSAHFFDGVFLGWGFDGVPAFSNDMFLQCVKDLESELDWNYQGGANLLLTDFLYDTKSSQGVLDFSQTIPLDISALLQEKKLAQLSPLIEEMIAPVRKERGEKAETSVWEISDYIALLHARRLFWQTLIKKIGVIMGLVDAVAPYAVRDLRKKDKRK